MTVPARPQSIVVSALKVAGVTVGEVVSASETVAPSERNAPIIRLLSRETRAPAKVVDSLAKAANTSSRLVSDLEPGKRTVAESAPDAIGAAQRE